jgi:molybdopterin-containing oxidoreductase family membrane subunit
MYESREAAHYFLFGGFHSVLFWVGLVTVGSVIPAIILFREKTGKSIPWIVFASILVVLGVICERYLIVIPGLTFPPDLFPGWEIIQGVVPEGIAVYSISFYEILQALGVLGLIGLAFMWGMKFMKLVPREARMIESSPTD